VAGQATARLKQHPAAFRLLCGSRIADPVGRRSRVGVLRAIAQVGHDAADLQRLVLLRQLPAAALEVIPQSEYAGHASGRTEPLRIAQPVVQEGVLQFAAHIPQTWSRLAELAGQAVCESPPGGGIRRLGPQIGTDAAAVLITVDLVAAVAAIGADQAVPTKQLRRGRFREPVAGPQVGDAVVTFQAGALDESPGVHRIVPERVVEPAVLSAPTLPVRKIVGRV